MVHMLLTKSEPTYFITWHNYCFFVIIYFHHHNKFQNSEICMFKKLRWMILLYDTFQNYS